MKIENQKEWDFITNEIHNGDKKNSIKREILLILQSELSKPNPNLEFYKEMKNFYKDLLN